MNNNMNSMNNSNRNYEFISEYDKGTLKDIVPNSQMLSNYEEISLTKMKLLLKQFIDNEKMTKYGSERDIDELIIYLIGYITTKFNIIFLKSPKVSQYHDNKPFKLVNYHNSITPTQIENIKKGKTEKLELDIQIGHDYKIYQFILKFTIIITQFNFKIINAIVVSMPLEKIITDIGNSLQESDGYKSVSDGNDDDDYIILKNKHIGNENLNVIRNIVSKDYYKTQYDEMEPVKNYNASQILLEEWNKSRDREALEMQYKCYSENIAGKIYKEYGNKVHCTSFHQDTNEYGVWDRPCIINDEFPYYKSNKNYENEHGRCLSNGRCEMPIGVSTIGYRIPKNEDKALCHNCDKVPGWNINDKGMTCCEEQKKISEQIESSLSPRLENTRFKSPDYMFENDRR